MKLLLLWLAFFLGCFLAGFLLHGPVALNLGVSVTLWVVVVALLLPMLAVLRHNHFVRRRQRRAADRRREAGDRFEREHPVRLDGLPASLVASVRALLLKEFGAFTPGNERREDRIIETLCLMLTKGARSSDMAEVMLDVMKYTGHPPDWKVSMTVTMELYRIRRESEVRPERPIEKSE